MTSKPKASPGDTDAGHLTDRFRASNEKLLAAALSHPRRPKETSAQLRAYHKLGQRLRRIAKPAYGRQVFVKLATALGQGLPWLYRVRAFAANYTKPQLEELVRLSSALGWGHASLLLYIKDAKRRSGLQKQAAAKHWTRQELLRVIQDRHPRRAYGGRPMRGLQSPSAALQQLATLSHEWVRGCRKLLERVEPTAKWRKHHADDLATAISALAELREECQAAELRLKSI